MTVFDLWQLAPAMRSEVSCKATRRMAIVSKVVRADEETTGTSLAIPRAERSSRLTDVNSLGMSPLAARGKGRVWLAQELQRGIAEIELEAQLAI